MLNKFLDKYKELEQVLKEDNISVLDYENIITDKEKLKVCRILRNYASHNDTKFISCTKEQIKFLEDLKISYLQDKDIVDKHYIKLPLTNNKYQDIIKAIQKKNFARIDLGIVNANICIKNYGKRKLSEVLKLEQVNVNDLMKDINSGTYEVYKNNKLVGVLVK